MSRPAAPTGTGPSGPQAPGRLGASRLCCSLAPAHPGRGPRVTPGHPGRKSRQEPPAGRARGARRGARRHSAQRHRRPGRLGGPRRRLLPRHHRRRAVRAEGWRHLAGHRHQPGRPPQGSPGTGATAASLAAGDTRCGNGGASITDGTGNTACACNGGAGALDLHSFSVASTAALTWTPGQAPAVVPGLSVQVTPAIASTYFVNADIWLALNVTATTAAYGSFADGLFIGTGGSYGAVDSSAPNDTIPLSGAVSLSPGAHTIDIRCTADSSSANVGVGLSKRHDGPPGKLTENHGRPGTIRSAGPAQVSPRGPADDPGLPGTSGGGPKRRLWPT